MSWMRIAGLCLIVSVAAGAAEVPLKLPPAGQGVSLRGEVQVSGGREFVELTINGEQVVQDLIWEPDGKSVLVLTKPGELRRISVPDLEEKALLDVKPTALRLQRSADAILILMELPQEVVVVSPRDFQILKRIPAPGLRDIGACPGSAMIFGSIDPTPPGDLCTVDMVTGLIKKVEPNIAGEKSGKKGGPAPSRLTPPPSRLTKPDAAAGARKAGERERPPNWPFGAHCLRLTPNGATLFSLDTFSRLCRYSIQKGVVTFEQSGEERLSGRDFCVSPISPHVAMPIYVSAARIEPHCLWFYVYQVNDLLNPIAKLNRTTGAFAFAHSGQSYYAQGLEKEDRKPIHFFEMTLDGRIVSDSLIKGPEYNTFRQILPMPGAKQGELFLLTCFKLYWSRQVAPPADAKAPPPP